MDSQKFDRLARGLSRRHALGGLAVVVGGLLGAGVADDAHAFSRRCRRFAISGGKSILAPFNYDDDMTIRLFKRDGGRAVIWDDRDGTIGNNGYAVAPRRFKARIGDEIQITARDSRGPCYSMEALYLHCCSNRSCTRSREYERLTRGVERVCKDRNWQPSEFFRKIWEIT